MRRQFNNFVSVFITGIRLLFLKLLNGKNFESGCIERFSPNVVVEVNRNSHIKFGNKICIHSGCKIKVRKGANLVIEDNVSINYNCIIVCHDEIEIGEGTAFGPSVYLYDHDHDYDYGVGIKERKFKTSPIKIGKNCWIGANTVILRGTTLGDNCVVGAGSVVKGTYENGKLIVQKRNTEII